LRRAFRNAGSAEIAVVDVTRRSLLGAGAASLAAASVLSAEARAASFGNPDQPPQDAVDAKNPASVTDPGQHSAAIADQFPAASSPPATDVGDMPQFWASFNNAPKRIQNGGWARHVTQADFQISETIAGVRELHWHPNADEWVYFIKGRARIGVFAAGPKAVTTNFNPGDIGYIKRTNGHYVKHTGDTDLEFLEVFRSDRFEDVSLSDWLTHTPPAMVAATFNTEQSTISKFPKDKPLILPG
jgi:oxalate decarboxylase